MFCRIHVVLRNCTNSLFSPRFPGAGFWIAGDTLALQMWFGTIFRDETQGKGKNLVFFASEKWHQVLFPMQTDCKRIVSFVDDEGVKNTWMPPVTGWVLAGYTICETRTRTKTIYATTPLQNQPRATHFWVVYWIIEQMDHSNGSFAHLRR